MEYIGSCGDKCSACPRFVATANNDMEQLHAILALYVKIGQRPSGTTVESLKCWGCKASQSCAFPRLRACVASKKLENCGQCDSYPCARVEQVFPKAEAFIEKAAGKTSGKFLSMFKEAFLRKKEYLDKIHDEIFK